MRIPRDINLGMKRDGLVVVVPSSHLSEPKHQTTTMTTTRTKRKREPRLRGAYEHYHNVLPEATVAQVWKDMKVGHLSNDVSQDDRPEHDPLVSSSPTIRDLQAWVELTSGFSYNRCTLDVAPTTSASASASASAEPAESAAVRGRASVPRSIVHVSETKTLMGGAAPSSVVLGAPIHHHRYVTVTESWQDVDLLVVNNRLNVCFSPSSSSSSSSDSSLTLYFSYE
jgi:hypothetical protein